MGLKVELEISDENVDRIAEAVIAKQNAAAKEEVKDTGEKRYTVKQAVEEFNLNKRTLQDHIRAGKLIANKPGGSKNYLIKESDLLKYLNNEK